MPTKLRDYKDLDIWQVAMDLAVAAYHLASRLPRDERFELSAQIRKAAVSVASNIAEGYGRYTRPEYLRFLGYSNGSMKELETQAILTERLGLLPTGSNADVLGYCGRMGQMFTALRRSLS